MYFKPISSNDVFGKFEVLNQYMEPIGEMTQDDFQVTFFMNGKEVCKSNDLMAAVEQMKEYYKDTKNEEAINLFRSGNRIEAIRIYKKYVGPNATIAQIRDYLERFVMVV